MPPSAVTLDQPPLRTCSICEDELPLTDGNFYRPPNAADFESWCRRCGRQRHGRGRRFGVEIEFVGTRYEVAMEALKNAGVPMYDPGELTYTHAIMDVWKLVSDGSLDGYGYELVSPPLRGDAGIKQVRKALRALRDAGAQVNRRCGLHVHFEVTDLNLRAFKRLARLWFMNQPAMDDLVAESRRRTQWARRLNEPDMDAIEGIPSMDDVQRVVSYLDRYKTLNLTCFPRYGTVEARQHQGTLNADKIEAWVAFGKAMISFAKSNKPLVASATGMELVLALAADHGLAARRARFLSNRFEQLVENTEQLRQRREEERRRDEERRVERQRRLGEARERARLESSRVDGLTVSRDEQRVNLDANVYPTLPPHVAPFFRDPAVCDDRACDVCRRMREDAVARAFAEEQQEREEQEREEQEREEREERERDLTTYRFRMDFRSPRPLYSPVVTNLDF